MDNAPTTRNVWVVERLRRGILSGEFEPGARLRADALGEAWGVSPTPVRESFQRLAADGLVEVAPGRGAHVTRLTIKDMVDVYSIRLLLEPMALRLSLEHRTPAWEAEVAAAFAGLREELEAGVPDVFSFEESHRAFHEALLSRCSSPRLLRLHRSFSDQAALYRVHSLGPRGGPVQILTEHEQLLQACLGGDVDLAAERLFDHIKLTVDTVLPELEAHSDPDVTDAQRLREVLVEAGRLLHGQEAGA